jgi:hypothetical protein
MKLLARWRSLSKYERGLFVVFLISLPLVNPWVRGDGVGYYAYVRSLLIDGDLRFENEYRQGNLGLVLNVADNSTGKLKATVYTPTGYVNNHQAVGPSILWAPFLVGVHVCVKASHGLGATVPADGFSRPYTVTMALATALYGFLGLYLAYRLARKYFEERWAFLATVGIWFASSLVVYMYFNPSWSHAHSAFVTSLFLWYWHRTRGRRSTAQWVTLGAISGLMLDVYYPNIVFLFIPLLEAIKNYRQVWRAPEGKGREFRRLFSLHLLYVLVAVVAFLPTLVTRQIMYGSPFRLGYEHLHDWAWGAPVLLKVLFSSTHGLLSWTPILIPALVGLVLFRRCDREFAGYLLVVGLTFYYLIASYPNWDGFSAFGNRFFVSLTPLFVVGLAAALDRWGALFRRPCRAWTFAALMVGAFIVWNLGFVFQWGTKMIPNRGPISWRQMAYNQVVVVPRRLGGSLVRYFSARGTLMQHLEQEDLREQRLLDTPPLPNQENKREH